VPHADRAAKQSKASGLQTFEQHLGKLERALVTKESADVERLQPRNLLYHIEQLCPPLLGYFISHDVNLDFTKMWRQKKWKKVVPNLPCSTRVR
ncbi:hypothetical protein FRC02_005721, partial [Tulasnella sp. 418]